MRDAIALVDTNLLVLLSVGTWNRDYISIHKRTSQFTPDDYDLLINILSQFKKILVTPNILSECSNLCAQTGEPARSHVLCALRALTHDRDEVYVRSSDASCHSTYVRLGLTDAAIHIAAQDATVFTTDLDLYLSLSAAGKNAVNFNHLRGLS